MNDDSQIPFEAVGDEPVEARIIAWALGEASAFEIAELERLCSERPELEIFRRRMNALHGLLGETAASKNDDAWKLPTAKREMVDQVLASHSAEIPSGKIATRSPRSGRQISLAIAACLILTVTIAALLMPAGLKRRDTALGYQSPNRKVDFMPSSSWAESVAMPSRPAVPATPALELKSEVLARSSETSEDAWSESQNGKAGALEKQDLERAIREQEGNVEERRKVLSNMVGTKKIIYRGEESSNFDVAQSDAFAEAKIAFKNDQEELQQLRLEKVDQDLEMAEQSSLSGGLGGGKNFSRRDHLADGRKPDSVETRTASASDSIKSEEFEMKALSSLAENDLSSLPSQPSAGAPAAEPFAGKLGREEGKSAALSGLAGNPAERESEVELQQNGSAIDSRVRSRDQASEGDVGDPVVGTLADGTAATQDQLPLNGVTNGLRSGDQAINRNNIDAVLNNPNRQRLYAEAPNTPIPLEPPGHLFGKIVDSDKNKDALAKNEGRPGKLKEAAKQDLLADDVPLDQKPSLPAAAPLTEESLASENPYSTFSLNISDASFKLAHARMQNGGRPAAEEVKVEQFYNAVDYGDPGPGNDEPVAATIEQSAHPVVPNRNLVRIALRTAAAGRGAAQPLRLTLLVDQSGSMVREDRRASLKHAINQLQGLLTENDRVTVIGFSRTPRLLAENQAGNQRLKLVELIHQTASEGGTNLEEAIKIGAELAERYQLAGAQNRLVLFTDGAANLGNANPDRLASQVAALRQKGLAFDIAGIGADGINDRLLGELARHGNGRYYLVGEERNSDFARQLAGAFRPAAENVKIQVIFNPERVGSYKLIGFEKDRLKTEDFRNDAVDAAELASDEAGVALYQVEVLPGGKGEIGEVSVRFRNVSQNEMAERSWTIPHQPAVPGFDRATASIQLAGLSLMVAEKLKGGPMAGAIDFNRFIPVSAGVKHHFRDSRRVADLLQMADQLR